MKINFLAALPFLMVAAIPLVPSSVNSAPSAATNGRREPSPCLPRSRPVWMVADRGFSR